MHRRILSWRSMLVLFLAVGVILGARATYKHYRWKRFAIVEPGRIYRSGQLANWQLEKAIASLGLKTVICLNDQQAEQERKLCAAKGVDFHYISMPSSGLGQPEQFGQVLRLLLDRARQPVLVHCHAGVARTGASIALYRMYYCGWSTQQAIEELRSFERHGRCEESLRQHVAHVFTDYILPGKHRQVQGLVQEPKDTPK